MIPLRFVPAAAAAIFEYEPDTTLRDTEQIPLLAEGAIESFIRREVLPYASHTWYVPSSVKPGYETSFTRHFYKLQPLRPLEELRADILALERAAVRARNREQNLADTEALDASTESSAAWTSC